MTITCALDFRENMSQLDQLGAVWQRPLIAVAESHSDAHRLGVTVRNHLGHEFSVHYNPGADGTPAHFAVLLAVRSQTAVTRARMFAYAYQAGRDSVS